MFYKFETIKKIEIDCTSYCNAFCGACDRNVDGGENQPNLNLNLSLQKTHFQFDHKYFANEMF